MKLHLYEELISDSLMELNETLSQENIEALAKNIAEGVEMYAEFASYSRPSSSPNTEIEKIKGRIKKRTKQKNLSSL